jgi:preprotein translocase subunit SecG
MEKITFWDAIFWIIIAILMGLAVYALFRGTLW